MQPEYQAHNESVLIENIKRGERVSFDVLVGMYQQRGLGIAYNLVGNIEDAKDVLQEAFVKVYLNISGFQQKSRFSTWFYRIVINCSLDFLRKRKSKERIFVRTVADEDGQEREIEIPDTRTEPAKVAMVKELGRELEDAIAGLSKMQRICFVLKHQNGLSVQEISQILKCNPQTVKVHLFRAVNNLRKRLSNYLV